MNELLALLMSLNVHTAILTFDDGPDLLYTPQVLDILKENNIKANFFLVGNRVLKYQQLTRRIVKEGHIIGGHSVSHKELTKIPLQQAIIEISDSMDYVNSYQFTNLFRFPYGSHNKELDKYCKDKGYKVIFWDVDTTDWKYPDKEVIFKKFKLRIAKSGDRAIILMHDIHPQTVQVLPMIIKYLKDNNIQTRVL